MGREHCQKVSYRWCVDDLDVFPTMFPDSQIAEQITLEKTKCMYLCVYGLGRYFRANLLSTVKASPAYTISFDESLKDKIQECQMDLIVRF